MRTIKLHYHNPFLSSCEAEVISTDPERGVVLDRTVAYAESGGQMGDTGKLIVRAGDQTEDIPFTDCQNGVGRLLLISDFPSVQVDTPVYHKVDKDQMHKFYPGQRVTVQIDTHRRGQLTISHSGIHLILMGLEKKYPGIYHIIRGCKIKPEGARLDFRTDQKFTPDDIQFVQEYVNEQIVLDKKMYVFPHRNETSAWYWQMDDYVIPCGGSHLLTTSNIGMVTVKKESLGKLNQRMSFEFSNYHLPDYAK